MAGDVIIQGPALWQTGLVAAGGAVVGGVASTVGGRWSTGQDLRERNRHALLMQDIPAYRTAAETLRAETFSLKPRVEAATRSWSAAIRQIEIRSRLLSEVETKTGGRLAQYLSADGQGHRKDLSTVASIVMDLEVLALELVRSQPSGRRALSRIRRRAAARAGSET